MTQDEFVANILEQIYQARQMAGDMQNEFPSRATLVMELAATCEALLAYMGKFRDLANALGAIIERAEAQTK